MKRIAGGLVCGGLLLVGVVVGGSAALAQSAPGRIVQASDGTLYLLRDGARQAIVPETIDDDELASYADGGEISGALLLSSGAATGPAPSAQNSGDAAAEAAPQTTSQDAQEAPAAQSEPAAQPGPAARAAPAPAAPAAQTACVAQPTRAKASCPAPAAPGVPNGPRFTTIQGNAPGRQASVTVQATAGAACALGYVTADGRRGAVDLAASQQTANSSGVVTWSFLVDPAAKPGTGSVNVSCGGVNISAPFPIADPGLRR
jgi:hypothetical protein